MEEKRKHLRRHIKAASDWLQQADKSIEREEDLKGDLKLMLAKAELQNAEKHQKHSRLTKIFSFVTAAMIALGILWVNDDSEKISQLTPPSMSTTKRDVAPDSLIPENIEMSAPLILSESSAGESTIAQENSTTNQEMISPQVETSSESQPIQENVESVNDSSESSLEWESNIQPSYSEPESTVEVNIYSEPYANTESNSISLNSAAPTEDMQKLMQSAGQILHAE